MKKTIKKLSIKTETLRRLVDEELSQAAGGTVNTYFCAPTQYYTCHVKTPSCPQ